MNRFKQSLNQGVENIRSSPRRARDTIDRAKTATRDTMNRGMESIRSSPERARDTIDRAKTAIRDTMNRGMESIRSSPERARATVDRARTATRDTMNRGMESIRSSPERSRATVDNARTATRDTMNRGMESIRSSPERASAAIGDTKRRLGDGVDHLSESLGSGARAIGEGIARSGMTNDMSYHDRSALSIPETGKNTMTNMLAEMASSSGMTGTTDIDSQVPEESEEDMKERLKKELRLRAQVGAEMEAANENRGQIGGDGDDLYCENDDEEEEQEDGNFKLRKMSTQEITDMLQSIPEAQNIMMMAGIRDISDAKMRKMDKLITSPYSTLIPKPVVFERPMSSFDMTFGALLRADTFRMLAMSTALTWVYCYVYVLYLHIRRAPPREYEIMMSSVYRFNAIMVCGNIIIRMIMK